jgi:CRISPR system Cascade subunit CasA
MATFDLIDRPWLPCLMADGAATELGLRQALTGAHELRELYDPSPLATVSLHRLLLAILHRAYEGPSSMEAWRAIWQEGRFDPATIDAYLECWRHCFDLFDPERPFFQVPFIADLADPRKQAPVAKLAQEAAAGNNATLFDHSNDDEPLPVPAAKAARDLVATQAFSIGFGKSYPFYLSDSSLIRGYSVLAVGGSLFETLMLNLLPYDRHRPMPWLRDDDPPIWEQDSPPEPGRDGTPVAGYADYLTWQSRQIHLIPDGGETVTRCQVRQRFKLAGSPLDPFKCYQADPQRGWRPRSFRPQRALWRDSTLLFQQIGTGPSGGQSRRPELMDWLARVKSERDAGRIAAQPRYRLRAFGVTTDDGNAASVVLWRREELPLPLALLEEPQAIVAVRQAIDLAEEVNRALGAGTRRLATLLLAPMADHADARQPDSEKAVRPLARSLGIEARFWPLLETPFAQFLTALPADRRVDPEGDEGDLIFGETTLPAWAATVRRAARRAFEEGTAGLDRSARSLKAVALARRHFEYRLAEAMKEEKGEAAA